MSFILTLAACAVLTIESPADLVGSNAVSRTKCYATEEDGATVLHLVGDQRPWSPATFEIDPNAAYRLSGEFRAEPGTEPGTLYFGFTQFNRGRLINSPPVNAVESTQTELAAPVSRGGTELRIVSAENWFTEDGTVVFGAKGDLTDLPNFDYTKGGITNLVRNADGTATLFLSKPVDGDHPAGTAVREHRHGGNYLYAGCWNIPAPREWTRFEGTVGGHALLGLPYDKWWPGAEKAGILILANYRSPESRTEVRNLKVETIQEGLLPPGELWTDDRGWPICAHGAGILTDCGRYWWFGEHLSYGTGRMHIGVHAYSSWNLRDWKDEGIAFKVDDSGNSPASDGCVIERPKVIFCRKTGCYMMFFHLEPKEDRASYSGGYVGMAVSPKPQGPYRFVCARRPLGDLCRDLTVFQDDDKRAYLVAASGARNSHLTVYPLTDDYCDFTGEKHAVEGSDHDEAPAILKANGWYFMLASGCTGRAPNAARYFRARTMTGPWTRMGNPARGIDPATGLGPEKTWGCQSAFALKLRDGSFVALFDRWNPQALHDSRYIWLPVETTDEGLMTISFKKGDAGNESD